MKIKNQQNKRKKAWMCNIVLTLCLICTILFVPITAKAAEKFDPAFYAATYVDVVQVLGTDSKVMYDHYLTYGQKEGRMAYPGAKGGEPVDGIADTKATIVQTPAEPEQTGNGLVPLDKLPHLKSLKKKCTDEEFRAAYDEAVAIVTPLVDMEKEEQLYNIAAILRRKVDSGEVYYSTDAPHYNDPYGYFVSGVSSCAGCARATGLCLDILGLPYEHVNENQWSHQWCRVNMGDSYWICDAYGLYVGQEPSPYGHPLETD